MIVVSDTSPLNYLILIGQVEVLPVLFQRVVAPPAVIVELKHVRTPDIVRSWAATPPSWLETIAPSVLDPTLRLGAGELSAICVARELNADALLVDERKALLIAKRLGLTVTGTLGVLEMAAERNLLELPSAITALRQTTFRATPHIFVELLRRDAVRRTNRPPT